MELNYLKRKKISPDWVHDLISSLLKIYNSKTQTIKEDPENASCKTQTIK